MAITVGSNGLVNSSLNDNFTRIKDAILAMNNPLAKNLTFTSDTPAGNFTNIIALIEYEMGESVINITNNLNPSTAIGIWLDILGLFYPGTGGRKAATSTEYNIVVTTSGAVNLTTDFTISDGVNSYFLKEDVSIASAGNTTLRFQATTSGNISSTINSINIIQTPILGVTAVNNPTTAIIAGQPLEDDDDFRFRILTARKQISGRAIYRIQTAVLAVSGVTYAMVYENDETYEVDDIPARAIYVVVEGGSDNDIATAVSTSKDAGVPTTGDESVLLQFANGTTQTIRFDRAVDLEIYARLTITQVGSDPISATLLKQYISDNLNKTIGQPCFSGDIVKLAEDYISDLGGVTSSDISLDDSTWVSSLTVSDLKSKFVLPTANITVTIV